MIMGLEFDYPQKSSPPASSGQKLFWFLHSCGQPIHPSNNSITIFLCFMQIPKLPNKKAKLRDPMKQSQPT